MQAKATQRSDRIGPTCVLALYSDEEAAAEVQSALGPHEVEVLAHLWSLLALAEKREAERRLRPGGGYLSAADKHKAQHGHQLSPGCCA